MAKFKVGDVIRTKGGNSILLAKILKVDLVYRLEILEAESDTFFKIGDTQSRFISTIDNDYELDRVFVATKQFDSSLDQILKE